MYEQLRDTIETLQNWGPCGGVTENERERERGGGREREKTFGEINGRHLHDRVNAPLTKSYKKKKQREGHTKNKIKGEL